MNRRDWLALTPAALGASLAAGSLDARAGTDAAGQGHADEQPFSYCLNTSTIQGQKLPISRVVEIAAEAGYRMIEPWVRELDQHVKDGGSLADLGKKIADLGLTVESAIGFFDWCVDDDARRAKGFEEARRSMEVVRQVGGTRIAAPPAGATQGEALALLPVADRYRELLDLGRQVGVLPQIEVWGFSKNLSRLGEVVQVAIESGHPDACVLADVYHLHKGGSGFGGLHLVNGRSMQVFHMNDYPAEPGRAEITDAHRVYPGDGVAPLPEILRTLTRSGFRGVLSLELFNREYWAQDPLVVARTGLEKMRSAVAASLA